MSHILLVEDEEKVRTILRDVLSRAGDLVEDALDGPSGLTAYRQNPADVVFVDFSMPGMDGLEFTRRLVREFPAARVVVMSGRARPGAVDPLAVARSVGAAEVLRKPFEPPEMLRLIDQVLD